MSNIQVRASFKIYDGKYEEFIKLAALCLASVKEKDSDTLQYDWFFSENQKECVIREKYTDSTAVLTHVGNLGGLLGELLEVSDMQLEVFGNASKELVTATAGLKPKFYSFFQGI